MNVIMTLSSQFIVLSKAIVIIHHCKAGKPDLEIDHSNYRENSIIHSNF